MNKISHRNIKSCILLTIFIFIVVSLSSDVKADESIESLQIQMTAYHQQINALMLKATQDPEVNALAIEQKLMDTQTAMHTASMAAQQQNVAYLKRNQKSNRKLALISQESDLLDVEADATINYLDFQDPSFINAANQIERLINQFEP